MTIWVDVDTALASVPVNSMPLVLSSDFLTIKADATYDQAGLALFWNFTTTAGTTTVTAVTPTTGDDHDWTDFTTSGMYGIEIPASGGDVSNDTEGFGFFTGVATGILPWRGPEIGFRDAVINDALIDSNTMLTSIDVGLLFESTIGTVTSQTAFICDENITTDDIWIGNIVTIHDVSTGEVCTRWCTDVVQSTETISVSSAAPFTVVPTDKVRVYREQHATYALNTYDPPTRSELTIDTNSILAKLLAYIRLITRSDGFVDTDDATELTAINADGGSGGGNYSPTTDSLESNYDATIVNTSKINTLDTNVDLVLVDTAVIGSATDTDIATDIANIATDIATVQTAADAIKAKTDSLTFTKASEIDANIQSVDDVTIGENGTGDQDFGEV